MGHTSFRNQCIFDIAEGVREGLSRFSRPSRVAVIYSETGDDNLCIYDPQNLFAGHELKLKEVYYNSSEWRRDTTDMLAIKENWHIHQTDNLHLTGLISFGCKSRSIFYQIWFTDHHPDMCSTGPTERWLEHTAWRLSHDLANKTDLYTGISGHFLREYATHAVRDYIVDKMNIIIGWDTQVRIYPILDAILGISRTREEGEWARGKLVFVEPSDLSKIEYAARFPSQELPSLENYKHVRKLLQAVENSERKLISDGKKIIGIATGNMPDFHIVADFRRGHGFIKINNDPVCSFSDGSFHSTTNRAKLVEVEESLLESGIDPSRENLLFKIVSRLVHYAEKEKYGCTLVIDLNDEPVEISGQNLQTPLDLRLETNLDLSKALAKVDGALHIGSDLNLHGFACLLDGRAIPGEDRARGARYNSALRFAAEHDHIIVVVVSSDRPVSIIQNGGELSSRCEWKPVSGYTSSTLTLKEWLKKSDAL